MTAFASIQSPIDSPSMSKTTEELISLLLIQVERIQHCLQGININDQSSLYTGLQHADDALERLVNACQTVGFKGLSDMGIHVSTNIHSFQAQLPTFKAEQLQLLRDWMFQVHTYLPNFNEARARQQVTKGLSDEHWAIPLSPDALDAFALQLDSEIKSINEHTEPFRIEIATDADISITLPNDVNQELLELLLQELPILTQQFSESVQRLQSSGNEQDIMIAQRLAHTLKGSANTVGVKGIAVLTHHLEDILIVCAKAQKIPSALADALLDASDCLESMSEALLGFNAPPENAKAVLQTILDWANRFDKEEWPDETIDTASAVVQPSDTTSHESNEHLASNLQPTMVRVAAEKIENLFRLSGESITLNSQAQESIRVMKKQLKDIHLQFGLLKKLGDELEQLIDVKNFSGQAITTTNSDFDSLEMDQYNELHTVSRRMAEAAVDAREIGFDINREMEKIGEVLEQQQNLVIEVQDVAMQTRLVSVSSIAPRLQRCIRQTCRLTGKQSDLLFTGENLLIDGDTLNALIDPLLHILRNAIDHGIEHESERLPLNKSRKGRITIEFGREGNHLLVRCQDDGRGLDYPAIRAAAEKRDWLAPGQSVTTTELQRFILRPNFSTRDISTQTSGRGVGISAVLNQIKSLGGKLSMESEADKGLMIELNIPLPLSLTHVLLVNVGQHRVTIANNGITQIHYIGEMALITANHQEKLSLDGKTYAFLKLDKLLKFSQQSKHNGDYGAILLVQHEDKTTAILVDSIIDTRDVVIKNLGHYLGKMSGFLGATIFGDGSVKPVIDLPTLLRATSHIITNDDDEPEIAESTEFERLSILIVDDSLSQRRALEQLLEDTGYKVHTARDGFEAIELLPQIKPNLVLTDLEMPRINGIELTAHIRAQYNEQRLPVIMVTSRTTLKHRQLAEKAGVDVYLTKPVPDEELIVKIQAFMDQVIRR